MERFRAALLAADAVELAGPEMLGARLSVAAANALAAAGVGLSMFGSAAFRAPIGASGIAATHAERLQFTTGQGPCLAAHRSGRMVMAGPAVMAAQWPMFHDQLVADTPYRAIAALPLGEGLSGVGALDLYFRTEPDMFMMAQADAMVVAAEIAEILTGTALALWLNAPPARERYQVSIAMGMITVHSNVTFPDALAMLRAHGHSTGRTVDEVARDVVGRALPVAALDPGADS